MPVDQFNYYHRFMNCPPGISRELRTEPLLKDIYIPSSGYFEKARGHFIERKSFPEIILIYCHEGQGFLKTSFGHWNIHPGQILFCLPDAYHSYGADNSNPWTIYWYHITGKAIPEWMEYLGVRSNNPVLKLKESSEFFAYFQKIEMEFEKGFYLNTAVSAAHYLKQQLCLIPSLCYPVAEENKEAFLDRCRRFLIENLNTKISLDDFSQYLGISKFHFTRIFNERTGLSPIQYALQFKIQKACHMLDTSDWKVLRIASRLGFEDPYYFSRIFKKVMGMSPKDYRNWKKG